MLGHQMARNSAPAPNLFAASAVAATDFSSCWLALPNGIRQRLEPMLAGSAVDTASRSNRRARAVAAR
ncbi:hypothetical protein [Nevskia sp.]|uniref:hypothetical protein n=1 Tax=Nevskia sp. TaxID=1929292 RepID=UPI0025E10C9E|nr:hypothetical protein [Nevskia sp.]